MKKSLLLAALLCLNSIVISAQQSSDYGRICVNAIQPEEQNLPEEARQSLENKLSKIVSTYGMASNGLDNRFVITSKIERISRDITQTTPARISQKLKVTIYVGDAVEDKIYAQTDVMVAGIGVTETKSLIQAFSRINANNPDITAMMDKAKANIISYYTDNCPFIIQEAEQLTNSQQYEAAIAKLIAVPNVCADCYTQCQNRAQSVYNLHINKEGLELIQSARNAWLLHKDYDCAEKALAILSQVNVQAECQSEANKLVEEINAGLRKIEASVAAQKKAEWEFRVRQYEDKIEMEKTKQADATMLSQQCIDALQNIGVAFGKNQKSRKIFSLF